MCSVTGALRGSLFCLTRAQGFNSSSSLFFFLFQGSNAGPPGGRPVQRRFTTVNERAMKLFKLSPVEIQKARQVAKKLDPRPSQVVGPIPVGPPGEKAKDGFRGPE